ncbi:hypothetical protein CP356_06730 [Lactobacillus sp. UMNPBX5]|nr:hypothetical protein CP356_06730 [Lactobacillus sp. UMNPBX5]
MSLHDKMTRLMDSARNTYPVSNLLGISDLSNILRSKTLVFSQPQMVGGAQISTNKFKAQNGVGFQMYPYDQTKYSINVTKGQRIMQSINIKTDGQISNSYISFYQNGKGHNNITPIITKVDDSTYKLQADFISTFDGSMLLLDINGLTFTNATYFELSNAHVAVTQVGGGNS